jgi:PTH2 family peptidyl-tRNA hydrolase
MKQVIVVRTDLGMGKGKIAVQVAHASLSAFLEAKRRNPELADAWLSEGQRKIVLKVNSLNELLDVVKKAEDEGLPIAIIEDAGLTQLKPGTITAVGIGPALDDVLDRITGNLKLL